MDLIYADRNGIELGILNKFQLDMDIGVDNDFQIAVCVDNNVLTYGYRVYAIETEYGGLINNIKVDTKTSRIYYMGRSWRGILSSKIIKPLQGNAYYVVNGEANSVIQEMINYTRLDGFFKVDDTVSNINISNYSFDRYTTLLNGLNKMLDTVNARLRIQYKDDGYVHLSAENIVDYSSEEEYSDDSKIYFIIEDNRLSVNHLVCLGKGELLDRQVIDLYVQADGSIGDTQYYFGTDEVMDVYDYPNVESLEELRKSGIERLKELQGTKTFEITVEDMDLELGDIVGCRERITGLYLARKVVNKIIKIYNNILSINYKVGD